jgi:hypothetical protein
MEPVPINWFQKKNSLPALVEFTFDHRLKTKKTSFVRFGYINSIYSGIMSEIMSLGFGFGMGITHICVILYI